MKMHVENPRGMKMNGIGGTCEVSREYRYTVKRDVRKLEIHNIQTQHHTCIIDII